MFRTDAQLIRLRNRHPVIQPDTRLHNRAARYATQLAGNAIRLRDRVALELSSCTTG